jgi:eukaryotic-like serine/threonine-protein kinase
MNQLAALLEGLPKKALGRLEQVCCRFEEAWQAGGRPRLEDFVAGPEGDERLALLHELLRLEVHYGRRAGECPSAAEYQARFPEATAVLQEVFAPSPAPDRPLSLPETEAEGPERAGPEARPPSTQEGHPPQAGLAAPCSADSGRPLPAAGPVVRALGAPDSPGRLQLHGEIGRGGMGAVLKGHDADLGREIAVKVLLEELAGRTELVQRFVEEAQVTGQLQHPNVVPVYGLGVFPDRRPYFTMKLVKGQTLSRLLAERADPTQDRARFLGIFLQVCQAVAYAHARGVIHRDLKPSNVMVGNFGEVQLMDWGLAKVLEKGDGAGESRAQGQDISVIQTAQGGADTQAGSVLGTPAYMAPEQALGEVDRLDQRADVFALGALLCEILTGQPPYPGENKEAVRRRAARADLADAFARLDDCGADAELVALAKRCLAAEPAARPQDGGALAAELTAYLEGVERRLRRAELERAAAEVKALEERKRRRLTLALAATVLALVFGGSGAALWVQQDRAARAAERARQDAEQARREAEQARQAAAVERDATAAHREAALLLQQGNYGASRAALRRAEGLLGAAGGHAELRRRVRELAQDLAMLERLDTIRLGQAAVARDGKGFDEARAAPEYREAFRAYGLDVPELAPAAAAKEIRRRSIRAELVAALDQWALLAPAGTRRRLLETAQAADPDAEGTLSKAREAAARQDVAALRRLAAGVQVEKMPPAGLWQVGILLYHTGAVQEAVDLMRAAQRQHPGAFWINHHLAYYLMRLQPPQLEEAVRYHTAAVALHPHSAGAYLNLGNALHRLRRNEEAATAYRAAIRLKPDYVHAYRNLGDVLRELRKFSEAMAAYDKALEINPKEAPAHNGRGMVLSAQKRYAEAASATRIAIRCDPRSSRFRENLALDLGKQGKPAEAVEECRKAVEVAPKDAYPRALLAGLLGEDRQWDEALVHAKIAVKLDDRLPEAHHALGRALAHSNQLEKAETAYREAIKLGPKNATKNATLYDDLGTVLGKLNRHKEAVGAHRRALEIQPSAARHYNLGLALYRHGDLRGAVDAYGKAIDLNKNDARIYLNLGAAYGGLRQLAEAEAAYRNAIELKSDYGKAYANLSVVLRNLRKGKEAVEASRKAVKYEPEDPLNHIHLGVSLMHEGEFAEALAALQNARRRMPDTHPQLGRLKELLRDCRRLPGLLKGELEPEDAAERLMAADLCARRLRRYARAAEFFAGALAAESKWAEDARAGHRYNAACCAALAAAGKGQDAGKLDDKERARLRKRALDWLRADLAAWQGRARSDQPGPVLGAVGMLAHWQSDPDLAGVRDARALAQLAREAQQDWHRLWSDVGDVLKRARGRFTQLETMQGSLTFAQRQKSHAVKLKAGVTYVFDMRSEQFDTLLRLVDAQGVLLAENDDIAPGKDLNSRISFVPTQDGDYRLIAGSFRQQGTGGYTVIVRSFRGNRQ